jgi:hypothetical protein
MAASLAFDEAKKYAKKRKFHVGEYVGEYEGGDHFEQKTAIRLQ